MGPAIKEEEKIERNCTLLNQARARRELLDAAAVRFGAYENITGRRKFTRVSQETLDQLEGEIKASIARIVANLSGGKTV